MVAKRDGLETRRTPRQDRSRQTVDAVFQAMIQLLPTSSSLVTLRATSRELTAPELSSSMTSAPAASDEDVPRFLSQCRGDVRPSEDSAAPAVRELPPSTSRLRRPELDGEDRALPHLRLDRQRPTVLLDE